MSGISINDKHTSEWGLMLTDFVISPPNAKKNMIDVPGMNGSIDLTQAINGQITYENRTISLSFTHRDTNIDEWQLLHNAIVRHCHGKKVKVILDFDPAHYYEGRMEITSEKVDQMHSYFNMVLDAFPYKLDVTSSSEDWIWDIFNFEEGVIREYHKLKVEDSLDITIIGSDYPSFPIITTTSPCKVICDESAYDLATGKQKMYELQLMAKEYHFKFIGNCEVTIEIRGGML